jgi:hypothetical protein
MAIMSAAWLATVQSGQTACSVVDAEAVKRLTGRQDFLKRGPMVSETSVQEPGRSGCSYLRLDFELATQAKPESFQQTRARLEKGGAKTQPVSGVGDQAFYWWSPKPGGARPVGIVLRAKSSELMIMQMTSSDSVEALKPQLLAVAKSAASKLK